MDKSTKTNRLLGLIKRPEHDLTSMQEWEESQKSEVPELQTKTIERLNSIEIQDYMKLLSPKTNEKYNLGEAIRIDEEAINFVKFLANYLNLKHQGKKFYLGEVFSNIVKLHKSDYLEVINEAKTDYLRL